MAKRKRDVPLLFWVSPEEKALIQKKMEQIGTTNLSAYLRKSQEKLWDAASSIVKSLAKLQ